MSKAEANGIVIEHDSFGSRDAEPIVLISGLGVQMIRWTVPFCEMLAAQGYWVIRFDNRDVGLSTHFHNAPIPEIAAVVSALAQGGRPHIPYTLYDMVDDAVGLLDALKIKRAHFVGRSMGGMIAQMVVSEHPHRALSLTSIMSSTGNPGLPQPTPEVMEMLIKRAPHPLEDEEGFLTQSIAFSRMISGPGYPFDEAMQRDQALAEVKRAYNPAGFARQIAALVAAGDLRVRLREISAPTLVMHGANDPLIPPAGGQDTASNIKGAELRIIDGMGHDLPPELYEDVTSAIAGNARRASTP
jgi:pimeloyl-ACP methyl ester carboxylesterase